MRFPVSKWRKKVSLGLDVGTEAVKAMVFARIEEKISISGFSLQYFDRFGVFDSYHLERDIYKKAISGAINEAMAGTDRKKMEEFSSVFLVLPSNMLRGRVIFQRVARNKRKNIIGKDEEKSIYQLVFRKIQQQIFQMFEKETGILPEELKFIRRDCLEIKIDGYPVPTILGFNGRFLDFKVLVTFLPKRYFQNVQEIMCSLGLKAFKLVHEAELLRSFLGSGGGLGLSRAVFLDVGGGTTQVFLVDNGRIDLVDGFEVGGESFSQTIVENFGMISDRARFLKHQYSKKNLSEGVRRRIREKFLEVSEEWILNLKSKLLSKKILIPSDIFIFGGASMLPEIGEVLEGDYLTDLPLAGKPRIEFLYPKNLGIINENSGKTLGKLEVFQQLPQYTPVSLICYAQ